MANVNKVILIGRITRDIELRHTPKGTAIAELGLAVNRSRTDESGQRIEETTFVDVTLWGKQAELAAQYLAKGREVYIEGRLQMDTWVDKESGQNRSKLKIVGENMQFISGGDKQGQSQQQPARPAQQQQAPTPDPDSMESDDIPF